MPMVPWIEIGAASGARIRRPSSAASRNSAASLPDQRVIVKPSRLGSSVGIAIVHHPDDPEYAGGADR